MALEALAAASFTRQPDTPPNTYSSEEIRTALRMGKDRFAQWARPLIEAGSLRVVKVRKHAIDGRLGTYTAYQFVV